MTFFTRRYSVDVTVSQGESASFFPVPRSGRASSSSLTRHLFACSQVKLPGMFPRVVLVQTL